MRKKHVQWVSRAIQLQRRLKKHGWSRTWQDLQGHGLLKLLTPAEVNQSTFEDLQNACRRRVLN